MPKIGMHENAGPSCKLENLLPFQVIRLVLDVDIVNPPVRSREDAQSAISVVNGVEVEKAMDRMRMAEERRQRVRNRAMVDMPRYELRWNVWDAVLSVDLIEAHLRTEHCLRDCAWWSEPK